MTAAFKRCGCGAEFDRAGWALLPRVGSMRAPPDRTGPADHIELRNCPCGSTIAVDLVAHPPRETFGELADAVREAPEPEKLEAARTVWRVLDVHGTSPERVGETSYAAQRLCRMGFDYARVPEARPVLRKLHELFQSYGAGS